MDTLLQDLRYAIRALAKSPGFTAVAVLSLALGLAACTVVFGVIYGVNFQPLPYKDAGRLVQLFEFMDQRCAPACIDQVSPETVRWWREHAQSFDSIAAAELVTIRIDDKDSSASVLGARVSAELFPLLGLRPFMGRPLLPSDFHDGAEPAVIIGRRLWAGRFASDRSAVGRSMRIDGSKYTIVGVMPSELVFPGRAEVWLPQQFTTSATSRSRLDVVARLRPGVSFDQARAELRDLSEVRQRENPQANASRIGAVLSMRAVAREIGAPFWMLLGAVGAALLIASANVASLSLMRALARERELAIRAALGADQLRLALPSVMEGVLVAIAGGAGGVILALWGKALATTLIQRVYGYPLSVTLSPLVLEAGLVLALFIGVLVGLAPAQHLRRIDLQQVLREGATTSSTGQRVGRLRQGLVVVEIAAVLVLLTGAGLLTASMLRIQHYDLGYDAEHVLVTNVTLPKEGQPDPRQMQLIGRQLADRLRLLRGVTSVTLWGESYPRSKRPPVPPSGPFDLAMTLEGGQTSLTLDAVPPFEYDVTPEFLDALGIRVVSGRSFTEADHAAAMPVAIVNERAAQLWWPGENPLGKRFKRGRAVEPGPWLTVVGVVENTHTIGKAGVFGAVANPGYFPLLFRPLLQSTPRRGYWIGVRATPPFTRIAATLRQESKAI